MAADPLVGKTLADRFEILERIGEGDYTRPHKVTSNDEMAAGVLHAIRRAGLTPVRSSIRGGTDGSRLSFMGLPCPNIFAGEHSFHSRLEWVSVRDMESAVRTIVHLAAIWEEKA